VPITLDQFIVSAACELGGERMPNLPSLRRGATLLDLFRLFPETSKPLIEFHEVLLRGLRPSRRASGN